MTPQPNNQSTTQNPVGRFMVATGAIIENEKTGKILIIQRNLDQDWQGGEWEICYGRIDQFEDTTAGLKRELKEELGLTKLEIKNVLTVWHIFRGPEKAKNELIGITYHCTTAEENIALSHEHIAYQWTTPEAALKLIKVEGIRRDLLKFIDYKKSSSIIVGKDVVGVGAGALIFNEEGKLLLSLRGPKAKNEVGKWEIPGGSIEFGETLEQGLKREVKEELGVEIEIVEMLQVCDHIIPDEHQHWVSPTYICKLVSGTPQIMEPEKCEKLGWFDLNETDNLPLSMVTKKDIEVLRKNNKEPNHHK